MPLLTIIFPNTGWIAPNRLLYCRRPMGLSIFTFIRSLWLIFCPLPSKNCTCRPVNLGGFRIHCFCSGQVRQSFKYLVNRRLRRLYRFNITVQSPINQGDYQQYTQTHIQKCQGLFVERNQWEWTYFDRINQIGSSP